MLVIAVYVLVNAALLRILTPAALASSTVPAADALAVIYGPVARTVVLLAAAASALAALHAAVLLTPRILYGMSRDRLFVGSGMYVTQKGVPLVAMWVATGVAVAFTRMGNFDFLFALGAVISVFADLLCAVALFVLRRREPHLPRPYRAFAYPWVPGVVVMASAALLIACIIANPRPSLMAFVVMGAAFPLFRFMRRAFARSDAKVSASA